MFNIFKKIAKGVKKVVDSVETVSLKIKLYDDVKTFFKKEPENKILNKTGIMVICVGIGMVLIAK